MIFISSYSNRPHSKGLVKDGLPHTILAEEDTEHQILGILQRPFLFLKQTYKRKKVLTYRIKYGPSKLQTEIPGSPDIQK